MPFTVRGEAVLFLVPILDLFTSNATMLSFLWWLVVLGILGRSTPCLTSVRSSVANRDKEELPLLVSHTLLFSACVTFRRLMPSSPFTQHFLKHPVVAVTWCLLALMPGELTVERDGLLEGKEKSSTTDSSDH